MDSLEEEIDRKIEEKELKAAAQIRRGLKTVKLGNYKFVATKGGAEFLNRIKEGCDLVSGWERKKQECQRIDLEKKQQKERELNKKVEFNMRINVLDHEEIIPYTTTQRGYEEFKRMMNPFKEEKEIERAEEIETLTFYDGVILVWEIIDRVIDEYFDEDEKDIYGQRYDLGLMDKMQDIMNNDVLDKIEKQRKKHLHELFEIRQSQYRI